MTPSLLIFDLDGTLIDSRKDLATAVNLMRRHFGLPALPVEQVTTFVGDGVRMLVTRALNGTAIDIEEAVRVMRPIYLANLASETELYPGVADGLRRLHAAGHVLAVATNKPIEATERILVHYGIRSFFRSVLGGGSTPHLKPDPEMAVTIMKDAGIGPERTWIIGDNHTDLECARRAGVRSVFCTFGFGLAGTEAPTVTIGAFDELTRFFAFLD